jgi:hypothetical protein
MTRRRKNLSKSKPREAMAAPIHPGHRPLPPPPLPLLQVVVRGVVSVAVIAVVAPSLAPVEVERSTSMIRLDYSVRRRLRRSRIKIFLVLTTRIIRIPLLGALT